LLFEHTRVKIPTDWFAPDIYLITPGEIAGFTNPAKIMVAGKDYPHVCVIVDDGDMSDGGPVECVGNNRYGQLGDGTITNTAIPVSVKGISNAIQISGGDSDTCAILADSSVKCWGSVHRTPFPLGISNVIQLSRNFALLGDGTV